MTSTYIVTTGDLTLVPSDEVIICGLFQEYEDAEACALAQPGDWTKKDSTIRTDVWHSKDYRFIAIEQWEIK